jgi:hypothetical protein
MPLSVTSAIFQQASTPALDMRRFLSALIGGEGVVTSGDMAVAQRAAGANLSVDVAAGQAVVQGDSITNQGMYYAYNDGVVNVTGFTAAHATLPRVDRVLLRVRDAFHGDAANDVAFVIVTGTATAGATLTNLAGAAAVPGSQLLLANVLIPAAATTITTANIDTRVGSVRPHLTVTSSQLAIFTRAAVSVAHGTLTILSADTTDSFRGGFTYPSDRIVTPAEGVYRIAAAVSFAAHATGDRYVSIANSAGQNFAMGTVARAGGPHDMTVTGLVSLPAAGTSRVEVLQTSGVPLNVTLVSHSIERVA